MPNTEAHALIIDDNEDIMIMLKIMLERRGYRASTKRDIQNIESFIIDLMPDFILMDMFLSGLEGCDVCRSIKSNAATSHIPVIMISAHPNSREKCLEAGATEFIYKPFDLNDLYSVVSKVSPQ